MGNGELEGITVKDIRVTVAWLRFIRYCQNWLPFGDIEIQIVNGEPKRRLGETSDVRFDREDMSFPPRKLSLELK